jgi:DNA-binding GntR family transcriptional regulator
LYARHGTRTHERGWVIGELDLRAVAASLGPRYRTVGDLAYSTLHHAIIAGLLAPGEKLHQEELARSLGISREPIRSAILQLASDGLVVVHPHRGATVSALSVHRIREIYDLRILLESYAIRLGIPGMTPERLARLERIAARLDRAKRSPASVRLRTEFYDVLYDRERHPVLVDLIDRLRSDVGRYWMSRRLVSEQEHGHRPLLEYARSAQVDSALEWLKSHFEQVADELVSVIVAETAGGVDSAVSTGA